jgi:acyl-CoA thioesterase FadM
MLTQLRVKVRQVMVFIDAKTERASPISTELVEAMSAFVPPVVLTTSN